MSKFPPSPSGIALYAEAFEQALALVGEVHRWPTPPDPRVSQSARQAARGLGAGRRLRRAAFDVVQIEMSGRALYEFYLAVGLVAGRPRPKVALTIHDAPSLVGPPLLFAALDRRGLRRAGSLLSKTVGTWLERFVLSRSDLVLALTASGADYLSSRYECAAVPMAHVVSPAGEMIQKRRVVFIPGYVDDVAGIVEAVQVVALRPDSEQWTVVVGSCADDVPVRVAASLTLAERALVRFAGYLTEADLVDQYREAGLVLRLASRGIAANALAASGPLSWAASHGCVVITNDSRAGAAELAHSGLVHQTIDPAGHLAQILAGWGGHDSAATLSARAVATLGIEVVAGQYAAAVTPLFDTEGIPADSLTRAPRGRSGRGATS